MSHDCPTCRSLRRDVKLCTNYHSHVPNFGDPDICEKCRDPWHEPAQPDGEVIARTTPPPKGKWATAMAEVQSCGHTTAQHLYHESGDFKLEPCTVVAAPWQRDMALSRLFQACDPLSKE